MSRLVMSIAVACAVAAPSVHADDLKALREEIAQLRANYEERISALEARLAQAEASDKTHKTRAEVAGDAQAGSRAPASASFNPEISLVLSGMYTRTTRDPIQASRDGTGGRERRFQGFLPSNGPFMPQARSFNLGETELVLTANVDPRFRGNFKLAIAPDNSLSLEEANVQTLGLGPGLGLKAGRFYSGIGYANEQHPHQWDFSDAALPYQAFFGFQQGYDGVQMKWLAPADLWLEFGAEAGRARNFPATDDTRHKNGLLSGGLFAHAGGDIGVSQSWRAGLSLLSSKPRDRRYEDLDSAGSWVKNAFSGRSRTAVADLVWKWAPDGNASERGFTFQGEYFRRKESGSLAYDVNGINLADAYASAQSGWYAQGVYRFMPRWRAGYRHDRLSTRSMNIGLVSGGAIAAADLPLLAPHEPRRHTLMAEWSSSEFARIRLQWARDDTRPGITDNQVWLHYIMSLGAHGAHKY